jgi:Ca-activated chloride channel family protein
MKKLLTVSAVAVAVTLAGCVNENGPKQRNTTSNTPTGYAPAITALPEDSVTDENRVARKIEQEVRSGDISPIINQAPVAYKAVQSTMAVSESIGLSYAPASPEQFSAYDQSKYKMYPVDRDRYINFDDNGIKLVHRDPVSTFSVDVDTASYSNIRRMLEMEGRLPPMDAVKVEEMINYFSYDYSLPESMDTPFSVATEIARSPWNPDRYLLQIGLKGYEPVAEQRPPANLVFLVDVSGSMMDQNKLPLVKRSLRLLVNKMQPEDRIALAVYAGAAGLVLESTPAAQAGKILRSLEQLQAGGSTNGGAGLQLAYDVAAENFIEGGINRVIIASDGDMNVGIADHEALKSLIERKRKSGIALTTLGFGSGNYNYALMEQLADIGNGNASYIDSISEAQKVLVNEMNSTLLTIARDVKIQVEFNPALVSQYRLIGYENRILNREDFRNDKVDAGDIGAGHTVTAFYEIALVDSDDTLLPELRYSQPESSQKDFSPAGELAYVSLRFKQPDAHVSKEIGQAVMVSSIVESMNQATRNLKFAAAVAGFGQILRGGKFTGDWNYENVADLARNSRGNDVHGYRSEFIRLVELADTLESQG